MGLTDLMAEIKQDQNNFVGDEAIEYKVLQHVLKLVEDKISEVKNQAVKWCVVSPHPKYHPINELYVVWVHSLNSCANGTWSSLLCA